MMSYRPATSLHFSWPLYEASAMLCTVHLNFCGSLPGLFCDDPPQDFYKKKRNIEERGHLVLLSTRG